VIESAEQGGIAMEVQEVDGKSLALLLVQDDDGDWERASVVTGKVRWNGRRLSLDMGDGQCPLPVPETNAACIRTVPDELKDELEGAELFMLLHVAPIPHDADVPSMPAMALHWPV
jgi:hypothetical protein